MSDAAAALMIRQAAALAVQDAAAHMRRVNTIATVALGLAQEMLLAGNNVQAALMAANLATSMTDGAASNFTLLCETAAKYDTAPVQPSGDDHG